jgi:hypothetical protein
MPTTDSLPVSVQIHEREKLMLRAMASDGTLLDDQVPRRLALEGAGAFICSSADVGRVSGVLWKGQLVVAGEMYLVEASSLGELCDRMEAVQQLGRVSAGIKALPGKGDWLPPAGVDDDNGAELLHLSRRRSEPATHRRRRR